MNTAQLSLLFPWILGNFEHFLFIDYEACKYESFQSILSIIILKLPKYRTQYVFL